MSADDERVLAELELLRNMQLSTMNGFRSSADILVNALNQTQYVTAPWTYTGIAVDQHYLFCDAAASCREDKAQASLRTPRAPQG